MCCPSLPRRLVDLTHPFLYLSLSLSYPHSFAVVLRHQVSLSFGFSRPLSICHNLSIFLVLSLGFSPSPISLALLHLCFLSQSCYQRRWCSSPIALLPWTNCYGGKLTLACLVSISISISFSTSLSFSLSNRFHFDFTVHSCFPTLLPILVWSCHHRTIGNS